MVALWLCSPSRWASKPRARGPGPEAGCWNQSKTGSVLALGSGNISSPRHRNGCPSTGQFLPHESSPIVWEMLCAIAVAGQKALILVWLHPGNSPYESRYSRKWYILRSETQLGCSSDTFLYVKALITGMTGGVQIAHAMRLVCRYLLLLASSASHRAALSTSLIIF